MTINNSLKEHSKQLSFYQLISENKLSIEIPIIQRDYAQGRASNKSIRESFINVLHKHVTGNSNIDLDFVYGEITGNNEDCFVPLDGQQRLTTLFLLHWYLATKEDKFKEFQEFMFADDSDSKSRFCYATRASSSEFCTALAKCDIDFGKVNAEKGEDRLSKTIKDMHWYFESWDNDPTVKAMLTMLDTIDGKFKDTENLFDRLLAKDKPVITFNFLNLKTLGLTDDLYIKMNSRGEPLSDFENFKAKFEQCIKRFSNELPEYELTYHRGSRKVRAHEYFSHKIDTRWSDLFWKYRNNKTNTFDKEIMNFIQTVITNNYALSSIKKKNEDTEKVIRKLRSDELAEKNQAYFYYEEIGCITKDLIENLIAIFDLLEGGNDKIKTYLEDSSYYDEDNVFEKAIARSTTYRDNLRFYAFYVYLIQFGKDDTGLTDWIRVVYNLTENTIYDSSGDYIRDIKIINLLVSKGQEILKYLANINNSIEGFSIFQKYEERVKASLILKSQEWREAIITIEKHDYFKGQIGFILEFAGITEYYEENGHCNWGQELNSRFLDKFKSYSSKANSVFSCIKDGSKSIKYLWERAVLTKGDYMIKTSAWRRNLLSTNSREYNIPRDFNWKRLLRLPNNRNYSSKDDLEERGLVKAVFDDVMFDADNIEKSLCDICKTALKSNTLKPWKVLLVRDPCCIDYCGHGFLRIESDYNIQLLTKARLSSWHAELYSYAFFKKYLENRDFTPFEYCKYEYVRTELGRAHAKIYGFIFEDIKFEIKITFCSDRQSYKISFVSFEPKNENSIQNEDRPIECTHIPNAIRDILNESKMTEIKNKKFTKYANTEEEVINLIEELCEKLKHIINGN
ncbi:DUF262 domain-containing protein [Sedimentisphaera salicampi]|uniref:GmrSD restriction endonucleases N-terminal domain-containing protein n=1 Tax=Sedimentisphaera salicampi TaxID=1941349 RepID=A0A1W6LMP6_9BACT|nr:DUF262 domain-containing protein [Sedimentisphaera salicampi]ARN57013.1 hypothetical protein STSP1_01406 [Sedimentisphaera salicampi]